MMLGFSRTLKPKSTREDPLEAGNSHLGIHVLLHKDERGPWGSVSQSRFSEKNLLTLK